LGGAALGQAAHLRAAGDGVAGIGKRGRIAHWVGCFRLWGTLCGAKPGPTKEAFHEVLRNHSGCPPLRRSASILWPVPPETHGPGIGGPGGERAPLHRQLYRELARLILEGRLGPGSRLPSSRDLARELGLARNTVLAALDQLTSEGYVEGRRGSG